MFLIQSNKVFNPRLIHSPFKGILTASRPLFRNDPSARKVHKCSYKPELNLFKVSSISTSIPTNVLLSFTKGNKDVSTTSNFLAKLSKTVLKYLSSTLNRLAMDGVVTDIPILSN